MDDYYLFYVEVVDGQRENEARQEFSWKQAVIDVEGQLCGSVVLDEDTTEVSQADDDIPLEQICLVEALQAALARSVSRDGEEDKNIQPDNEIEQEHPGLSHEKRSTKKAEHCPTRLVLLFLKELTLDINVLRRLL
ncbi:hypothetical protein V8E54_008554 [Elaphomyces granulatus]